MSPIKTSAIVLKSIKWKDTSKIITLYTRETGKISVVAKGVRKLKSSYGGVLESINLIEVIIYYSSKRQVQILGSVSLENSFPQIKKDIERTSYAYAILELISILVPIGSADGIFFDFIKTLLEEMEEIKEPKIIFWFFILKISSYMGFRPNLDSCTLCSGYLDVPEFYFSFQRGGLVCKNCSGTNIGGWRVTTNVQTFLSKLQSTNYKTISVQSLKVEEEFPYTEFLLSYLRYHSDEKLELNSLKILK